MHSDKIKSAKKELVKHLAPKQQFSKYCLKHYVLDTAIEIGEKIDTIYTELKKHKDEVVLYLNHRHGWFEQDGGFISRPSKGPA